MSSCYQILDPAGPPVPLLISAPHCGTEIPPELRGRLDPTLVDELDDTDWFTDRLYGFAREFGATLIHAVYSRWVIDLNRDPSSQALYNDGRILTGLVPTTDFCGQKLYRQVSMEPDDLEVAQRLERYYQPYHSKVAAIVQAMSERFGGVLFWDAHSIRRHVPMIRSEPFGDLMLGDNDGRSADRSISDAVFAALGQGTFSTFRNHPFKGGYLTRSVGRPQQGVHALQLEMSKDLYMDDAQLTYDETRAARIQSLLRSTLEAGLTALEKRHHG